MPLEGHLWTTPVENFDLRFTWNREAGCRSVRNISAPPFRVVVPRETERPIPPPTAGRIRSTASATSASPHRVQSKGRAVAAVRSWSQRSASVARTSPYRVQSKRAAMTTVRSFHVKPTQAPSAPGAPCPPQRRHPAPSPRGPFHVEPTKPALRILSDPTSATPVSPHRVQSKSRAVTTIRSFHVEPNRPWRPRSPALRVRDAGVAPQGAEQESRRDHDPVVPRGTDRRAVVPATHVRTATSPHGVQRKTSRCPPSGSSQWNRSRTPGSVFRRLRMTPSGFRSAAFHVERSTTAAPVRVPGADRAGAGPSHDGARRRGNARPHRRDSPARGDGHPAGAWSWSPSATLPHRG